MLKAYRKKYASKNFVFHYIRRRDERRDFIQNYIIFLILHGKNIKIPGKVLRIG